MPTYEYLCSECDHRFDLRQGFDSSPLTDCPRCGKLARRQMSAVPIIFKGSGWYTTDYAKKSGSYPSTPSSSDGVARDGASASQREESRERAREERGKPPAPAATSSASGSSEAKPSGAKSAD